MNIRSFSMLFMGILLISSCKMDKSATIEEETVKTKYQISPFPSSPDFPNANLKNLRYEDGVFNFDVSNYELGAQTSDVDSKMCANSAKGQHIHLIVNNEPYAAKYTSEFEHQIEKGDHYLLAFLSRSYHESIKTNEANIAMKVYVENNTIMGQTVLKDPALFYSRPKGTYIGKKNTEKVMLDFYLKNVEISEGGKYINANINGEVHKLTEWKPYYVEGLNMGDNYISLTLMDHEGKQMDIPNNPVKRVFTLKEDPQPEG